MTVVDIDDLESADPELAATREHRGWHEYCCTATPSICLHSLEANPDLTAITYLDADLMFFEDPAVLFAEMGSSSVLIVPHRFSKRWSHSTATHGTFNVGFNTFRRDSQGLAALTWWRERCLEWCYFRVEPGRYGDQRYLDEFPRRFGEVHILQNPTGGVAPWNTEGVRFERRGDRVLADGRALIYYHYASLRLYRGRNARGAERLARVAGGRVPALGAFHRTGAGEPLIWRTWPGFRPSTAEIECVWEPYMCRVTAAVEELRHSDAGFDRGVSEPTLSQLIVAVADGSVPPDVRRAAAWIRRSRLGRVVPR